MNSIEFVCIDYPLSAHFQLPLTPSQLQRLKIMSRAQDKRAANVCELVADLADSWGNPVCFTVPAEQPTVTNG